MLNSRLRVLVVDDSVFFRHRIEEVLSCATDIEIVGFAGDGREAVQRNAELKPDLITMDVRMPGMDGISAVRRIMAEQPTRILMLSAVTKQGASETLDALEAGAIDFLPKEQSKMSSAKASYDFAVSFLDRIRTVGRSRFTPRQLAFGNGGSHVRPLTSSQVRTHPSGKIQLVAIGASTGGPVAVQAILSNLPRDFALPIVVAVHMPSSFTAAYAERLNRVSAIEVREARDREPLTPGCALIAPGGKQLTVENASVGSVVRVTEALPGDVYHPSVDRLFHSVALAYKQQVLGLVLTGMGSDGLQGATQIKDAGGHVWSQDERSCVVYGMPQVIEKAGLSSRVLPINAVAAQLMKAL
jgi:two-component system chemotaxis response regulator CheB